MSEKFPTTLVVGLVVAVAIAAGAYFILGSDGSPADSLQTIVSGNLPSDSLTATGEDVDTTAILVQLNQLRNIEINTNTFDTETFLSLRDYSVTIAEQPIGRQNPFIPSTFSQQGSPISLNMDAVSQQQLEIFNASNVGSSIRDSEEGTLSDEAETDDEAATSSPDEDNDTDED